MLLSAGTRLGPYEILEQIGAGGMGQVYSALDTRLNRTVAVKISAEQFGERFEREARSIAALSHPNICIVYDVGPNYLVMEYISGPTLAERIAKGAMPLNQALPIARQIAVALEAAHEKGIMHRDLKPANIKLTTENDVKVLDFGLAKAFEAESGVGNPADSPTLTVATRAGMLLGTAGYMSPEQARGLPPDKRADIWAFGVVLMEMLTGRTTFAGGTVSDTLASVLKSDPDWSTLPSDTPLVIRRLLRRCLERDRKQRLHDIGDARLELDAPPEAVEETAAPRSSRRSSWAWLTAAAAAVACAVLAIIHFREPPAAPRETIRFQFQLPPKTGFRGYIAISPDGRNIGFNAVPPDGRPRIYLRPIGGLEARPLDGTDHVSNFFWSPDGRSIGFWANGKLKRVELGGGPPQTICETRVALGGTWARDGHIIFGTNEAGLSRVAASGGAPAALTTLDSSAQERYHCWPVLLPDGKHLLYLAGVANDPEQNHLYVAVLDGSQLKDRKRLLASRTGALYVPSPDSENRGHLLFMRESTLLAQRFDAGRLELAGDAFPVADHVGSFLTRGYFGASRSGVVAYSAGGGQGTELEWRDRQGNSLGSLGAGRFSLDVNLSRDARRLAVSGSETFTGTDIWLLDLLRGTTSRFTFRNGGQSNPVWSPDDRRVAFSSANPRGIFVKASSGAGEEERIVGGDEPARPWDWSTDGKFLLYVTDSSKTRSDLWIMPLHAGGKPWQFLKTEFSETQGQFSPDRRWVAYSSDESGQFEVYVRSFDGTESRASSDDKRQISTGGGNQPRWRRDGKELFYLAPDGGLMAVEIRTSGKFEFGIPKVLFVTRVLPPQTFRNDSYRYDATADGTRFLIVRPQHEVADTPITAIVDWRGDRP